MTWIQRTVVVFFGFCNERRLDFHGKHLRETNERKEGEGEGKGKRERKRGIEIERERGGGKRERREESGSAKGMKRTISFRMKSVRVFIGERSEIARPEHSSCSMFTSNVTQSTRVWSDASNVCLMTVVERGERVK